MKQCEINAIRKYARGLEKQQCNKNKEVLESIDYDADTYWDAKEDLLNNSEFHIEDNRLTEQNARQFMKYQKLIIEFMNNRKRITKLLFKEKIIIMKLAKVGK